jgi:hypothetical protein
MPARDPLPQPSSQDDPPPQGPRRPVLWLVLAAVGLTGLILFLMNRYPDAIAGSSWEQSRVVYMALWAAALGGSLIVHWRARPGRMLRYVAIWVAIGAALMIGYNLFGAREPCEPLQRPVSFVIGPVAALGYTRRRQDAKCVTMTSSKGAGPCCSTSANTTSRFCWG